MTSWGPIGTLSDHSQAIFIIINVGAGGRVEKVATLSLRLNH